MTVHVGAQTAWSTRESVNDEERMLRGRGVYLGNSWPHFSHGCFLAGFLSFFEGGEGPPDDGDGVLLGGECALAMTRGRELAGVSLYTDSSSASHNCG